MIRTFVCNNCGYEKKVTEDDLESFECDICLVGIMCPETENYN
jgi:hypothetical protein